MNNLPTQKECYELWDEHEMPENIRAHVLMVTKVADAVATHIENKGHDVNAELVNRGGLLHDIAKYECIQSKKDENHGVLGAKIVLKKGWSKELADVIENHNLHLFSEDLTTEEQIVNYADRRVKHDEIVSIRERIDDLKDRYPKWADTMEITYPKYDTFEKKYNLSDLKI